MRENGKPFSYARKVGILKRRQMARKTQHPGLFSIFTHLTERERLLLYETSRALPDNAVVVETGSYLGASTCFLAAGAQLNNGRVYAVDT